MSCKNIKYCNSGQLEYYTINSSQQECLCVCVSECVLLLRLQTKKQALGKGGDQGTKLMLHDRSHPQVFMSAPLAGFKSAQWRENTANL